MAFMISHRTNELIVYQNDIFEVQATDVVQVKRIYLRQTWTGSQKTPHFISDKKKEIEKYSLLRIQEACLWRNM